MAIANAMLCVSLFMPWAVTSGGRHLLGIDFLASGPPGVITGAAILAPLAVLAVLILSATFDGLARLRSPVKSTILIMYIVAWLATSTLSVVFAVVDGVESGGGLLLAILACIVAVAAWSLRTASSAPREPGTLKPPSNRETFRRPPGSDGNGAIV